jgi:ribosomal protein L23
MGILKYPLSTEKTITNIGKQNVVAYIVDSRATKPQIKKEFETIFGVKVSNVRTINAPTNIKKAFITIGKGHRAEDIAKRLKLV